MKLTATHATIIVCTLIAACVALVVTGNATVKELAPYITGLLGLLAPSPTQVFGGGK